MKTFNLKEQITDLLGEPVYDKMKVVQLVEPLDVQYFVDRQGNKDSGEINMGVIEAKNLTYQKEIYSVLKQAGNSQNNQQIKTSFDKDEMGMLMLKVVADTEVSLSVDDRNNIIKASKEFSDTDVYVQIKNLLDPKEEEDKEEKKEKKVKDKDE